MAIDFCLGLTLLLSMWATAKCDIPNEAINMECHDRFFVIAVDLAFTGNKPHFEAVDESGVYAITKRSAAQCGYSIGVLPLLGHVELRASYFSCHTENKDDEVFTFNFNLVVANEGKIASYALNKTCSPSLPWSPREVTCEVNYMEVSVNSEVTCPSESKKEDWNAALKSAYTSATSDWQVMLHGGEEQVMPMNLSEAHKRGYSFDLTDSRLVLRAPYGQPESFSTEVNGVPVEAVHATLFSRQRWVVLMVDLVAACSMHEGSYNDSGYMMWDTPEVLHPLMTSQHEAQVKIGVNGELVEEPVAEERGYIVEKQNAIIQIRVPYNAEGAIRKSLVSGDLFEFYIFDLYLEQMLFGDDQMDTRLRAHRTLATPLLPRFLFSENRTVPEERVFTVYLGDVPEDVELAAVHLNGQKCKAPFTNESSLTITKVIQPNNNHGYTLKVSMFAPVIRQKFSKEDAAMQHTLEINYTLTVLPENEPFYHLASVMAFTDVSPPVFDAVCTESGISFKLDHRPFDYLWEITIDSDLLTPELAEQHGYIMSNDSNSLLLEVPLLSQGYHYEGFNLKGFIELIMCSTDGRMTVVADLALAIPNGGNPARTNLRDKYCGPKETDGSRALFSFALNSCGSTVKLGKEYVTYENEIFYSKKLRALKNPADPSSDIDRVTMQCTYPLSGLFRLFSVYKFESDKAGFGRIVHSAHSTEGLLSPTMEPTTVFQTPVFLKNFPKKGAKGQLQTKLNPFNSL
ncbi:Zona pellucida sperm-binding protein 4 [Dissostichus eleginoides]|uniref:Zona pellucida sperm-binding protein 4 n=1 Tax=Dissostichus eleginoides TaxID=100907 RepID=A0AAD9BWV6_DISEL|nr:Zona pellucida sperm-binding protein 4 [Dissostichus eleginoides]